MLECGKPVCDYFPISPPLDALPSSIMESSDDESPIVSQASIESSSHSVEYRSIVDLPEKDTFKRSSHYHLTYRWEIEEFYNEIIVNNENAEDFFLVKHSPEFPDNVTDPLRFVLMMQSDPENINFEDGRYFIWNLILGTKLINEISVRFKFSLFDYAGDHIFSKESEYQPLTYGSSLELGKFGFTVPRAEDHELLNESITAFCEMDIISEKFNGKGADLKFLNKTAKCKYINHMESILKDGKFTDLIVNVEDKEFHVHKAILCARSPVFAAMFENETKEQDENRINIHGIEEDVFEVLLYHIYTGKVQSLELYAAELFTAADMYQFDELKTICEEWICANLTIDTICDIFILADMHSASKMKDVVLEFITDNATQVMATEGWNKFSTTRLDLLEQVVKQMVGSMSARLQFEEKNHKRLKFN